jgi:hypothetical protein
MMHYVFLSILELTILTESMTRYLFDQAQAVSVKL